MADYPMIFNICASNGGFELQLTLSDGMPLALFFY